MEDESNEKERAERAELEAMKAKTNRSLNTHNNAGTPPEAVRIGPKLKIAAAVMALAALLTWGGFTESHKAVTQSLSSMTLNDTQAYNLVLSTYHRNYSAPIKVFEGRQTFLKVWDAGKVDGDVISVNGVRFGLPSPQKPTLLVVPAGIGGVTVTGVSQGTLPTITLAVLSEAGGLTYVALAEGETITVPTTVVR